jgi:hypothetical protein
MGGLEVSKTLLAGLSAAKPSTEDLEQEILAQLEEQDVISLDMLTLLLPQYSWSQIFHAVDGLARSGRIILRRYHFDYTLFSTHFAA